MPPPSNGLTGLGKFRRHGDISSQRVRLRTESGAARVALLRIEEAKPPSHFYYIIRLSVEINIQKLKEYLYH